MIVIGLFKGILRRTACQKYRRIGWPEGKWRFKIQKEEAVAQGLEG